MKESEKIKVVYVEPGKTASIRLIDKGLESYQKIVGGWIEQFCPFDDPIAIICNEEGKIEGLQLNRAIKDKNGKVLDIIAGTFFICGLGEENYCSIPDGLCMKYHDMFYNPEYFMEVKGE